MIHTAKNDSAVSPVIGTILLVAISVVLIAIILAVVMGFGGDTNEKKVGLNAKPETGNNATLILYGGASIPELVKLEMIDQGSTNGSYVKLWEKTSGDSDVFVGLPYLAEGVAQPLESMAVYDTRINVRGTFSDGTEVILLVQPMTFYDVAGTHSDTSNKSIVNVPDVNNIILKSAAITITYENMTNSPTEYIIYYQLADESTDAVPMIVTGSNDYSGSFSATPTDLIQGREYKTWGEIKTSSGKKVTGAEITFTADPIKVSVPSINTGLSSNSAWIWITYYNSASIPTETIICYQVQGTNDVQRINVTGDGKEPDGSYNKSLSGFSGNTLYEAWGEVKTADGGIGIGPKANFTTTPIKFNNVGISEKTSYSVWAWFAYQNADVAPIKTFICYQVNGTDSAQRVQVTGDGKIPSGGYNGQITGLTRDTEYEVWGEMEMSGGGTVKGNKTAFQTTIPTVLSGTSIGVSIITSTSAWIWLTYANADEVPAKTEICYQVAGSGNEQKLSVTGNGGKPTGSYNGQISGLSSNTDYEVWGQITMGNGDVYKSSSVQTFRTSA